MTFVKKMDSFFKQSDASVVKDALLAQLVIAVKEVQVDTKPVESNSDNSASFLSTVLEAIFIHSLKETLMNKMSQAIVTDLGQRPDPNFWAPLLIFSHRDVIRQISNLSQVTTDVGRGRAWLRLALNEGLLSSYLHSMATDNGSLKPYYSNNAFLRDSEKLDLTKQLIEGIETCAFCYTCNSSLLNVWTNMPLLMAGISTAPLRSFPITSGTDVAQTLSHSDEDGQSNKSSDASNPVLMYGYADHMKKSKLMVDEEEALKIILGTPVNESPLQIKINSDNNSEDIAVDLATEFPHQFQMEQNLDLQISDKSSALKSLDKKEPNRLIKASEAVTTTCTVVAFASETTTSTPPVELLSKNSLTKSSPVPIVVSTIHQSYDSLLRSYNNVNGGNLAKPNLKDVMQRYEESGRSSESDIGVDGVSGQEQDNAEMYSSINSGCDFEVVPRSCSLICSTIPEYSLLVHYLTNLAREQGLDAQNYSCSFCKNPIGVNLENVRLCSFTGDYYCKECYGSPHEEWIIPARVLHNWDFRKYPVSGRAEKFLIDIQDHPLVDLKAINPRLYVVVDEMTQLQALRMQLNLLRAYLFTCRQPIGEELKKQIWPKEYLYEHVHLYSVSDLLKIPHGLLIQMLEKAVTFSRQHVLSCSLCKQKGFICEICSAQNVIYPFDLNTTYKCRLCNAVFHSGCLNRNKPCPKCKRQKQRREQDLAES